MLHFEDERWRGALVGVEDEQPWVLERQRSKRGIALLCVTVEGPRRDVRATRAGDVGGAIGGFGVEDVDVVRKRDGVEAAGKVGFFVAREDEDGEHEGRD